MDLFSVFLFLAFFLFLGCAIAFFSLFHGLWFVVLGGSLWGTDIGSGSSLWGDIDLKVRARTCPLCCIDPLPYIDRCLDDCSVARIIVIDSQTNKQTMRAQPRPRQHFANSCTFPGSILLTCPLKRTLFGLFVWITYNEGWNVIMTVTGSVSQLRGSEFL